jgi:hypothetical protein
MQEERAEREPKNKVSFCGGQVLPLQILSTTHPFLCFMAACNSAYIEHHVELLNCDHASFDYNQRS